MATYVIGDVQGCLAPLQALLATLRFDPARDRAWFAGDLVNRGPDSLGVLRFVRSLGASAQTVLGNHDLHLLARAHGFASARKRDTLDDVLQAPDCAELLAWLRTRPLMLHEPARELAVVHAGLLPQWSLARARELAQEVESILAGDDYRGLLAHMYGDTPARWDEKLSGISRVRVIINALTRLRYCDGDGRMDFVEKGPPERGPPRLFPWFAVPGRVSQGARIVFGHWSTLGVGEYHGAIALDSGCVWGQRLTAYCIDEQRFISTSCGNVG